VNVYAWGHTAGAWLSLPKGGDHSRLLDGFKGRPMRDTWRPLPVELVDRGDRGRHLDVPDIIGLYELPAFSAEAVARIGDYLSQFGELLPLVCPDGEFFAYNITNLVDALDQAASTIVRFRDGRWLDVTDYVFEYERVRDAGIFKLPQMTAPPFLTDEAVGRIQSTGLRGLSPLSGRPHFFPIEVRGEGENGARSG
jgi:hypothetical protein